jgi:hypothetical protein
MDPGHRPHFRVETPEERYERVLRWLREEVWPITAPNGPNEPMSREERARYLGYGPDDE